MLHSIEKSLRGRLHDVLYPPRDIKEGDVQLLSGILTEHVLPVAPANPRILLVGLGDRVEEILAARNVFPDSHITAIDPGSSFDAAERIWHKYLSEHKTARRGMRQHVVLSAEKIEDVPGTFDIVMAFSLSPMLQNTDNVSALIQRATSLVVVTANNNQDTWNGVKEHTHIDGLLAKQPQLTFPVRDHALLDNTSQSTQTDAFVWVGKKYATI